MSLIRVAIHGLPRSGTTWLGELFNSSPHTIYRFQPLFSYALKDYLNEDSSLDRIEQFFLRLLTIRDPFLDQTEHRRTGLLPTFLKEGPTHLVYKEIRYHNVLFNLMQNAASVKLIALVRDPISTLESWFNAPREFRRDRGWEIEREWRTAPSKNQCRSEEFYGFEGWQRAVCIFHDLVRRFADRVRIVRYEDLVGSTREQVGELFEFCGLELDNQTLRFIEQSRARTVDHPYAVYKEKAFQPNRELKLPHEFVSEIRTALRGSEFERYLNLNTTAT